MPEATGTFAPLVIARKPQAVVRPTTPAQARAAR
jgi:hypothetical protein